MIPSVKGVRRLTAVKKKKKKVRRIVTVTPGAKKRVKKKVKRKVKVIKRSPSSSSATTSNNGKPVTRRRATAETMAASQRDISVSEFFAKNRHLLGFDNPRKALLTTVKEAVDNSIDACEEAAILPEIWVHIQQTGTNRYKVGVQDNGPGIVKRQIPLIFGKLLYGSKFHRLRQSRGQQGIGISAAGRYVRRADHWQTGKDHLQDLQA
jgi:hypothetical protein